MTTSLQDTNLLKHSERVKKLKRAYGPLLTEEKLKEILSRPERDRQQTVPGFWPDGTVRGMTLDNLE